MFDPTKEKVNYKESQREVVILEWDRGEGIQDFSMPYTLETLNNTEKGGESMLCMMTDFTNFLLSYHKHLIMH